MMFRLTVILFFFFFNDTATTEIYTLSLHDALPISFTQAKGFGIPSRARILTVKTHLDRNTQFEVTVLSRSEEHTSELQSQSNLVCRLLLEKKKKTAQYNSHTQFSC